MAHQEAERTEGIVVVRHDVGERVGNVVTGNDLLRFAGLIRKLYSCYQHVRYDNNT